MSRIEGNEAINGGVHVGFIEVEVLVVTIYTGNSTHNIINTTINTVNGNADGEENKRTGTFDEYYRNTRTNVQYFVKNNSEGSYETIFHVGLMT